MSKVPAHFELIPEIVALRDEIAPQTLITINGDIRDRAHGEELVKQYGVDGVMIGRGIFHNPFAFATESNPIASLPAVSSEAAPKTPLPSYASLRRSLVAGPVTLSEGTSAARVSPAAYARETRSEAVLLDLLNYHLDLYDQWQPQLGRPFETLKRFFKIYVRDFPDAAALREQLMNTKTTDEVRNIIKKAAP